MDAQTYHGIMKAPQAPCRPTASWRSVPATAIDCPTAIAMDDAVTAARLPWHTRWNEAASGDAAAAVGIAIRLLDPAVDSDERDLAMTALALCALEGDAAACLVVSHAIRRMPGADRASMRLATSWLALAFGKLPFGDDVGSRRS